MGMDDGEAAANCYGHGYGFGVHSKGPWTPLPQRLLARSRFATTLPPRTSSEVGAIVVTNRYLGSCKGGAGSRAAVGMGRWKERTWKMKRREKGGADDRLGGTVVTWRPAKGPGAGSRRVLSWVGKLGVAGVEPAALALGLSRSAMYSHVARLERAGLLTCVVAGDGRGGVVVLTRAGAREVEARRLRSGQAFGDSHEFGPAGVAVGQHAGPEQRGGERECGCVDHPLHLTERRAEVGLSRAARRTRS